jgi:glycosyltransferase involved in cell wall biosynthesis
MKRIVLFTDTFPYRGVTESTFISPELQSLSERFNEIILIPSQNKGNLFDLSEYKNVRVESSYALSIKVRSSLSLCRVVFSKIGLLSIMKECKYIKNRQQLFSLLRFIDKIQQFQKWLKLFIGKEKIDNSSTLFYTYWFHIETTALALHLKNQAKIITRAHGYDVYDERVMFRSSYLRNETLKYLTAVFTASHHAQVYLQSKFPIYSSKIDTHYLGAIKKQDKLTLNHSNKIITFLSCARIHPVKRIPLMAELLIGLSSKLQDYKIQWIHIGNGDDRHNICLSNKSINLYIDFRGELPNEMVHRAYADEIIDWTVLTSESEGGCPITICESLSYGVPVIATQVGGVSEIVTDKNGILLSENPDVEELYSKIMPYLHERDLYFSLKQQAFNDYKNKFDAKRNSRAFTNQLINLS